MVTFSNTSFSNQHLEPHRRCRRSILNSARHASLKSAKRSIDRLIAISRRSIRNPVRLQIGIEYLASDSFRHSQRPSTLPDAEHRAAASWKVFWQRAPQGVLSCCGYKLRAALPHMIPAMACYAARLLAGWRDKTVAAPTDIDNEPIPITSVTQRAAQCRNMDSEGGRLDT